MPIIQDVLGQLAFALLISGQLTAVIAVHRMHDVTARKTAVTRNGRSARAANASVAAVERRSQAI